MATVAVQQSSHPHGFLLHQQQQHQQYHHHQESAAVPVIPTSQPAVHKPQPADPFYGHEELARMCSRYIRHVFNCPADSQKDLQPIPPNTKPTESTMSLARFIAYAFHRTRLPTSVAFHALHILNRLKARYPAASCAFGHRLFLTSYMISSKVVCDDTYSNKSWAIVGQGFYELKDVNLMEREMIHYLSWDLTISGTELAEFTTIVRRDYKKGVPKRKFEPILDSKSRSEGMESFGKGSIEVEKKPVPVSAPTVIPPISISIPPILEKPSHHSPVPPPYSSPDEDYSPYSNSSSSSSASSRESSPPSPCLKTPPDVDSSVESEWEQVSGKPVPIEFKGNHFHHLNHNGGSDIAMASIQHAVSKIAVVAPGDNVHEQGFAVPLQW